MYSSSPLVTVLMPVYNGEKYLPESIESILNQTYTNFELLIIDDCSSDNSIKIIENYDDSRIRLIRNDENIGQTKTLNKGIKISRGSYIARSDQDDISDSNRLSLQYNYLSNNTNVALLGTSVNFLDDSGNILFVYKAATSHEKILEMFCMGNPIMHSSVMFNRKIAIALDGYSTNYKICQDADLWLRIAKRKKVNNLKPILASIRIHKDQVTNSSYFDRLRYIEAERIYNNVSKIKNLSKQSIVMASAVGHYYQCKIKGDMKLKAIYIDIINSYPTLIINKFFWWKIINISIRYFKSRF